MRRERERFTVQYTTMQNLEGNEMHEIDTNLNGEHYFYSLNNKQI